MTLKTNAPEFQTFLTSVERDLFNNTKPNDVKDNLSEEERSSLKNWRKDVPFNKESELVMWLLGKGNRFVIVDKETNKLKAQQQIVMSWFQELNYDSIKEHIKKMNNGVKNSFEKRKFRKNRRSILLIMMYNLVRILIDC